MKIRQGFVSNSSSSSFVLLGFEVPGFEGNAWEACEEFDCNCMTDTEDGLPDDAKHPVFGYRLGDFASDGWYEAPTVEPLNDILKDVRELQEKLGCQEQELKIWTGTRAS